MLRIVLFATLLVAFGVIAAPTAVAPGSLEDLCEQHTGLCSGTTWGCWFRELVPPDVECRF